MSDLDDGGGIVLAVQEAEHKGDGTLTTLSAQEAEHKRDSIL